ncbi:MAG: hypothetical protein A2298_02155 [Gammaproteobacteria bacterium RIFOXYB2_FULL_38_6]|nr:MAG: hypothetical protein A2298_02155 [Gammaproteobacteria bacterium RIFOXYB2_FULL_38_6]
MVSKQIRKKTKALSVQDGKNSQESHQREPLTGPRANVQSKLFHVNHVINPLVASAAPLLAVATQLQELRETPDFKTLHHELIHEVRAFENNAYTHGYRAQMILAARYLLCALIDEIILMQVWGKESEWQQKNLLMSFQKEQMDEERCFAILNHALEDPAVYLDLLELGYLCLSLGFQGKYRNMKDGHLELIRFIDDLYYLIRRQRGEFSRQLLIPPPLKKNKRLSFLILPPKWITLIVAMIVLAVILFAYHVRLNHETVSVDQTLQVLQVSDRN